MKLLFMFLLLTSTEHALSHSYEIDTSATNTSLAKTNDAIRDDFLDLFSYQDENESIKRIGVLEENYEQANLFFSNLSEEEKNSYAQFILSHTSNNLALLNDEVFQLIALANHGKVVAVAPYHKKLGTTYYAIKIIKKNGIDVPDYIFNLIKNLKESLKLIES